ncbi:major capsid protein [Cupriavidus sp. 30B13]|uniref:major capsid protein n=1 Tax=Cupriavidus sp. 30B13 TaxID=3384241 RepID=UPI003B8EB58D
MATLPSNGGAVTLTDFAKSINPDGSVADVIELLTQSNEALLDMTWKEGNLPTGHRTTVRTGLPTPTWRKLYQGVQPTKSKRAQVDDACGMLEARNEVDRDLADLNGNSSAFRLSEAQAEVEGMNQALSQALFYGDTTVTPERFTGLAPRYSSLTALNGGNIVDGGGTGSDNASVWLVVWGENTVTGIYPKGSQAGLQHQDLGEIDAFDQQTPPARFRAYADLWKWKCGITVRDWRYAVRIANIDISDLVGQTGTQAPTAATALLKLLIRAMARIPMMGMGKPVFYANRTVKEWLSIAALDKSQNALAIRPAIDQFGQVVPGSLGNGTLTFQGVPIRTVDQLLSTEGRVV